jgi:hypothetical protein
MGIYLGNKQVKLIVNNTVSKLYIETLINDSKKLLSFDNYILKSFDNYYLIPKEEKING